MILGDVIAQFRAENKMSMQEFADRAGLSKAYISILERNINPKTGKAPIPTLETIKAVAGVVGKEVNSLLADLDRTQQIRIPQFSKNFPIRSMLLDNFDQLNSIGQELLMEISESMLRSGVYSEPLIVTNAMGADTDADGIDPDKEGHC